MACLCCLLFCSNYRKHAQMTNCYRRLGQFLCSFVDVIKTPPSLDNVCHLLLQAVQFRSLWTARASRLSPPSRVTASDLTSTARLIFTPAGQLTLSFPTLLTWSDVFDVRNSYPGRMLPGMTFTIEPGVSEGSPNILVLEDNWTAVSPDHSRSAQFEHTVLITETGVEILTQTT